MYCVESVDLDFVERLERTVRKWCVRRVDDTDGDHHLQFELREPGFRLCLSYVWTCWQELADAGVHV